MICGGLRDFTARSIFSLSSALYLIGMTMRLRYDEEYELFVSRVFQSVGCSGGNMYGATFRHPEILVPELNRGNTLQHIE